MLFSLWVFLPWRFILAKGQLAKHIISAAFLTLHLQCRMLDMKSLPKHIFNSLAYISCLTDSKVVDKDMTAHGVYLRGNTPDVNIMYAFYSGYFV